jgi:hypothetical protein
MQRTRKIAEVLVSTIFVFGMTVIGFRIEEPALGLFAAIPVYLYFKADFSK